MALLTARRTIKDKISAYFLLVAEIEPELPHEILLLGCQLFRGRIRHNGVQLIAHAGVGFGVLVGHAAAQAARQFVMLALHQVLLHKRVTHV